MSNHYPQAACLWLAHPDGRVLSVTRRTSDRICLPGGKVDAGETPLQAALRETAEETGIVVQQAQPLMVGLCENDNGPSQSFETHVFWAPWDQVTLPQSLEEHIVPRWVSPETLVDLGAMPRFNALIAAAWDERNREPTSASPPRRPKL